jgi:hypothetical protein
MGSGRSLGPVRVRVARGRVLRFDRLRDDAAESRGDGALHGLCVCAGARD